MRRATLVLFFLAAALTAVVASSCFSDPKPNCAFSCGTASECPSDYACGDDGRCHLMDGEGNLLACETPLAPDASTADGGAVGGDAATADGGGADAGAIDAAAIDAPMIDASMIDAPVIDAPMIDAPMIDAAVIDAAVIDAAVIDAAVIDAAPM